MSALTAGFVAQILNKLHQDADTVDRQRFGETTEATQTSGFTLEQVAAETIAEERVDYRAVYHGFADNFLAISPTYGRFLYAIARACKATRIVEFDTSMGISTIYLAAALQDNGGGHLISSELEPGQVARARQPRRGWPRRSGGYPRRRRARYAEASRRRGRSAADRRRILPLPAGAQAGRTLAEAWSGGPRGERLRAGISGLCP